MGTSKALELIDDNVHSLKSSRYIPDGYDFMSCSDLAPAPVLTHAYIDSSDDSFAFHLITKLAPSDLMHLSISRMSPVEGQMHMNALVATLPALQTFTVLDCIENHAFLAKWFSPRQRLPFTRYGLQLHITMRKSMPPRWRRGGENNYHYTLSNVLFRQYKESPKAIYGTEIRHIAISNVAVGRLVVDNVDDPAFGLANLRILTIRVPASDHRGFWNVTLEHEAQRKGRLGLPLPALLQSTASAETNARALSVQDLRNLRFVVIYGRYFWVEHFSLTDTSGHWTR